MHSPTFPGTFSLNYLICTFVWVKYKISFNMKDSDHFGKCNFPFHYLRQSRVLFVNLLLFADTLPCKPGVRALLGLQKLLHFKLSNMHSPTFQQGSQLASCRAVFCAGFNGVSWTPHGVHVETMWCQCGNYIASRCNPSSVHLETK